MQKGKTNSFDWHESGEVSNDGALPEDTEKNTHLQRVRTERNSKDVRCLSKTKEQGTQDDFSGEAPSKRSIGE